MTYREIFAPWFLRSVVNDTLKAVTRNTRTIPLETHMPNNTASLAEAYTDLEARLAQLDTNEALSVAIAQLTPEQRAVIVMRYYLGLSDIEISTKLNSTPGMVRWRLHRARKRLRDLLPAWASPNSKIITEREAGVASPAFAPHEKKGDLK